VRKHLVILLLAAAFAGKAAPVQAAPAQAAPLAGLGCEACHRLTAEDPEERRKAPDLFYAGDKFQKPWLISFLKKPVIIRKAGFASAPGFLSGEAAGEAHPALSDADARRAADELLALKLPGLASGLASGEPLSKVERVRAKILFEREHGCIACHEGVNLAGQARGGLSGPSLASAGNRLNGDWIVHWLKTPEKFIARSRMPVYRLDDETLSLLTGYILSLKNPPEAR